MPRTQTLVQLTDELIEVLDRAAARRSCSRSAVIREAIEEFVARDRARLVDERILAGYRTHPPGVPDVWGDIETLGDLASVELLTRLDLEEGDESW